MPRAIGRALLTGLTWTLCAAAGLAQLPQTLPSARLNYIFPAGGKVGTTFDMKVTGDDLDDASKLVFSHPGITAQLVTADQGLGQTGPQPVYGSFKIAIAKDVPPGVYEVRVQGKFGLSNPRAFVVGSLPEITETEPNDLPKQANNVAIETTINGICEGPALDYFNFAAKKGQRVIIDCWAFRIDSRLDATLVLYDADGREIERNHNTNRRDPLIDFTPAADGEYLVSVHDHMFGYYATPGECFYRLTISTAPYVDFVFPPADLPGAKRAFTLFGRNLPGGKAVPGVSLGGKKLDMLTLPIPLPADRSRELVRDGGLHVEPSEAFLDGFSYRLKSEAGHSNPALITYATAPIVIEDAPTSASKPALVQPPCEYIGQFYPRGKRGWVSFQAKKGDVYWLEVYSQRLGLPTDPRMVIQQVTKDEKIVDIASVDDRMSNSERVHWSLLDSVLFEMATHDPAYRFVAPEDGTYRVMVQDLAKPNQDAKGDPRRVYRLAIRKPAPDFRLVAVPRPPTNLPAEHSSQATVWSPSLRPGGTELIEVFADRRDGFDGEIQISAENLPADVTAMPAVIAPGQPSATLILRAADDAPVGMSAIKIIGKARVGTTEIVRPSRYGTMIWAVQLTGVTYHRSRLTDQLWVSVMASEPAPFSLQVDPNARFETSLAGTVNVPIKVARRGDFRGAVELFTYGLPPTINGPLHAQPKYHKPITLAADKDATDFTITVPNFVPPGTYTFFLSAVGTANWTRAPEKLKPAEARLAVMEKLVAENDARLKSATQMQANAAKALADAQAAKGNVKNALAAKTSADKALADADQKAKKDAASLESFRKELVRIREQAKSAPLKISTASNPITITIAPAPLDLRIASSKVSVKQGAKIEVPITIQRKYGFSGPIQAQCLAAYNISGVNSPPLTIAVDKSEGKLVIEALPTVAPGSYTTAIQAAVAFNGQNLLLKQDLTLIVASK